MKQIDPIERALDAYFSLDELSRRIFHATVRRIEDMYSKHEVQYVGTTGEPKPKRGRPPGSKNRRKGIDYDAIRIREELELRHNNGAVEEGL